MDESVLKIAGQVDQLISLDLWHKFGPRDTVRRMYEAARQVVDGEAESP